jgi:hypothetical protein
MSALSTAKVFHTSAIQCLNTLWSTQAFPWQIYFMDAGIPLKGLAILPFGSPLKLPEE